MGQKHASRYCDHCDRRVRAIGEKPNHLLHFLITFCTCGLWAIVWVIVALSAVGGYRCSRCGMEV